MRIIALFAVVTIWILAVVAIALGGRDETLARPTALAPIGMKWNQK